MDIQDRALGWGKNILLVALGIVALGLVTAHLGGGFVTMALFAAIIVAVHSYYRWYSPRTSD